MAEQPLPPEKIAAGKKLVAEAGSEASMSIHPRPTPARTPPHPIRGDGVVLDSQDGEAGHDSDFEDLLEEGGGASTVTATTGGLSAATIAEGEAEVEQQMDFPLSSMAAHSHRVTKPPFSVSVPLTMPVSLLNAPESHSTLSSNPPTSPQSPQPTLAAPGPSPSLSPATLRLTSQIAALQLKLSETQLLLTTANAQLSNPENAENIVKTHIKLLHEYNEIKDVGLGLMGLIADGRGVRVGTVMAEYGLGEKD